MNSSNRKLWFPAKKYGWGWGFPCRWQGWVVFFVYLVLLASGIFYFKLRENTIWFILYMTLITIILVLICWSKGEKPRWRWGD